MEVARVSVRAGYWRAVSLTPNNTNARGAAHDRGVLTLPRCNKDEFPPLSGRIMFYPLAAFIAIAMDYF